MGQGLANGKIAVMLFLQCISAVKEGTWLFRSVFVLLENIAIMSFRSLLRYILRCDSADYVKIVTGIFGSFSLSEYFFDYLVHQVCQIKAE